MLKQQLVPYLNQEGIQVFRSDGMGNKNSGRKTFTTSLADDGTINTRRTRAISIHKDAGFEYIDPATGNKVSQAPNGDPLTTLDLKDLNDARKNLDDLYEGTLGQSRDFTIKVPIKKDTDFSQLLGAFREAAAEHDGMLPVNVALEGDWADFNIGQTGGPDGGKEPPTLYNSPATTFISLADADGDGLPDATEILLGTDPQKYDTDGDGVSDGRELLLDETDPLKANSYKPGAPKTDTTMIEDPARESVIEGSLEDHRSNNREGTAKIQATNSGASGLIVRVHELIETEQLDGSIEKDFDSMTTYGETTIDLDTINGNRNFRLTISANSLNKDKKYVLVAYSPDGQNPVMGTEITLQSITLNPNLSAGSSLASGQDDTPKQIPIQETGKTTIPQVSDWTVEGKQLVGWSQDPNAQVPDTIGEDILYNGSEVDASQLTSKDLYAVWKDNVSVKVTKRWPSETDPSVQPANLGETVRIGLMYQKAEGHPGAEVVHDRLTPYYPLENSIKDLGADGTVEWTNLAGYNDRGERLSYIAVEVPHGTSPAGQAYEDVFYNFNPQTDQWSSLGISLTPSVFDDSGNLSAQGYKTQFFTLKNTSGDVDSYSSATQRRINQETVNGQASPNFYTGYEITMSNTKVEIGAPSITQGYDGDESLKIVPPLDRSVQSITINLPDKPGQTDRKIVLKKDSMAHSEPLLAYAIDLVYTNVRGLSRDIVIDGNNAWIEITGIDPLEQGEVYTATASDGTFTSDESSMTVRYKQASGIPTEVAQGIKTDQGRTVITAKAGSVSGINPTVESTFEIYLLDPTGPEVNFNDGEGGTSKTINGRKIVNRIGRPIQGEYDPTTGEVKFELPRRLIQDGDQIHIVQTDPNRTPNTHQEALTIDLRAPVITGGDVEGVQNSEITPVEFTADEAYVSYRPKTESDKFVPGLTASTSFDPVNNTTTWSVYGRPTETADNLKKTIVFSDRFGNETEYTYNVNITGRIVENPSGDIPAEGYARVNFKVDDAKARLDGTTKFDVYIDETNPVRFESITKPEVKITDQAYSFKGDLTYEDGQGNTQTAGNRTLINEATIGDDKTVDFTAVLTSYEHIVKDSLTVQLNDEVTGEDFVTNLDKMPAGTTYKFVDKASSPEIESDTAKTDTPGEQSLTLRITQPGEDSRDYPVKLIVRDDIIVKDDSNPENPDPKIYSEVTVNAGDGSFGNDDAGQAITEKLVFIRKDAQVSQDEIIEKTGKPVANKSNETFDKLTRDQVGNSDLLATEKFRADTKLYAQYKDKDKIAPVDFDQPMMGDISVVVTIPTPGTDEPAIEKITVDVDGNKYEVIKGDNPGEWKLGTDTLTEESGKLSIPVDRLRKDQKVTVIAENADKVQSEPNTKTVGAQTGDLGPIQVDTIKDKDKTIKLTPPAKDGNEANKISVDLPGGNKLTLDKDQDGNWTGKDQADNPITVYQDPEDTTGEKLVVELPDGTSLGRDDIVKISAEDGKGNISTEEIVVKPDDKVEAPIVEEVVEGDDKILVTLPENNKTLTIKFGTQEITLDDSMNPGEWMFNNTILNTTSDGKVEIPASILKGDPDAVFAKDEEISFVITDAKGEQSDTVTVTVQEAAKPGVPEQLYLPEEPKQILTGDISGNRNITPDNIKLKDSNGNEVTGLPVTIENGKYVIDITNLPEDTRTKDDVDGGQTNPYEDLQVVIQEEGRKEFKSNPINVDKLAPFLEEPTREIDGPTTIFTGKTDPENGTVTAKIVDGINEYHASIDDQGNILMESTDNIFENAKIVVTDRYGNEREVEIITTTQEPVVDDNINYKLVQPRNGQRALNFTSDAGITFHVEVVRNEDVIGSFEVLSENVTTIRLRGSNGPIILETGDTISVRAEQEGRTTSTKLYTVN